MGADWKKEFPNPFPFVKKYIFVKNDFFGCECCYLGNILFCTFPTTKITVDDVSSAIIAAIERK
jgi:hypothetical protein